MYGRRLVATVALALACLGLCGCSSPYTEASSTEAPNARYEYSAKADAAVEDYAAGASEEMDNASDTAMIRRSADVQLRSKDYDAATKDLDALLKQFAKVVLEQSEHSDSYRYSGRSATVRFRVAAEDFDALFKAIEDTASWSVENSQRYADDVTKQYNDTEQRIDALQVRYDWYKEQVQTTENPELAREYSDAMFDTLDEITRLKNQNEELSTDVKYSIITISLYEDTTVSDIDESVGLWDEIVNEAMVLPKNIVAAFGHLLLFIISALPTLLVLGCIIAVAMLIRKAWVRRHPSSSPAKSRWRPFARKDASRPAQPDTTNPPADES